MTMTTQADDGAGRPCVALIKVMYKAVGTPQPPMGLLSVGHSLLAAGYRVRVFHVTHDEALECMDAVAAEAPSMVGFSLITGDPLDIVGACCRKLKQRIPGAAIVFGGVHPTIEPVQCLETGYVDYVVLNEGEHTIVALADALRDGGPVREITGLAFIEDGAPVVNPFAGFEKDLDVFGMAWELVDVERYINPHYQGVERVLQGYVASRGCPHACRFCYNQFFNKRRWRHPSAEKLVGDLNALIDKHRLGGVVFLDDNFTVNKTWMSSVLSGIKACGLHLETRIDYIDDAFLKELVDHRVKNLFIGVESGSDRILTLIDKGFTVADIHRALGLIESYGITVKLSFIFGVPTETYAEYRQTLALIIWCIENITRVGFTVGFYLPYPGTPLFETCVERGFKKPARFEEWTALDRWGKQDMDLPWVEGHYITAGETAVLRELTSRLLSLRNASSWGARLRYRALRFRFLHSGSALLRGTSRLRHAVAWVRRYLRWRLSPQSLHRSLLSQRYRLGAAFRWLRFRVLASGKMRDHKTYLAQQYRRSFSRKTKQGGVRTRILIDAVLQAGELAPDAKILCIGCRNAFELDVFAQRGFPEVIGIDLFSFDRRIRVMDMHDLSFSDNSFDVVYSSHSLEHAKRPERVASEIARVIKPRGVVALEVPMRDPKGAELVHFSGIDSLVTLFKPYGPDVLWSEELPVGADGNPEGTAIVRGVVRLREAADRDA